MLVSVNQLTNISLYLTHSSYFSLLRPGLVQISVPEIQVSEGEKKECQ